MSRALRGRTVVLAAAMILGGCGGGTPAPATNGTGATGGPGGSVANGQTTGPGSSVAASQGTTQSTGPAPTGNATGIAAGDHSCALLGAAVACWGPSSAAEVTSGYVNGSLTPVAVAGLTDATSLAVGRGFTCAVRSGGVAACWGNNSSGAFGTGEGSADPSATPVPVPGITNATAVAADSHACALLAGGTVSCWGINTLGQLGNGAKAQSSLPLGPVGVTGLNDAVAISVGGNGTCAVRSGGGVVCWGSISTDYGATPAAVPDVADAKSVVVGDRYACALRSGGSVVCWGDNSYGQLGNGLGQSYGGTSPATSATPLAVTGLTDATAISAFYLHTCAVRQDHSVVCWGRNDSGMNGDGTTQTSWTPVPVAGVTSAVGVAAGTSHACAVLSSGGVVCWGSGYGGNLGNGTGTDSLIPVAVSGL